jgi:AraC-like DNA-binding protein
MNEQSRHIGDGERSGVLVPSNLVRFKAEWVPPADALRDVVDTYWAVRWRLEHGESVTQRIIDFPAITLSIEDGNVPAPFMVTKVRPGAWSRVIAGRGSVFAIRLKPAGLAVLSDLDATGLRHEQPLTEAVDERAHALLRAIASGTSVLERAAQADRVILTMLDERPIGRGQRIANAALHALTSSARVRPGGVIATELGISERTLQRALRSTLGIGPNDVARRIRLQEVVRQLSLPEADTARTAAELGYVDQAHLINEFRSVAGITPGHYVRELTLSLSELQASPGSR